MRPARRSPIGDTPCGLPSANFALDILANYAFFFICGILCGLGRLGEFIHPKRRDLFMPITGIAGMKAARRGFRTLFYFRTGYATYLIILLGAVNVLTSTYFLAIEEVPFIKEIFPTFEIYVITAVLVAIPVVTVVGYAHYKRIGAHSAAMAINMQNNIFNYKFQPGFTREVFGPAYKMILRSVLKRSISEKLTDEEIGEIDRLRRRLRHLIDGGSVGSYARGVIDD